MIKLTPRQQRAILSMEPGKLYPFETLEGHVRVNLFGNGAVASARVSAGVIYMTLTEFGEQLRAELGGK